MLFTLISATFASPPLFPRGGSSLLLAGGQFTGTVARAWIKFTTSENATQVLIKSIVQPTCSISTRPLKHRFPSHTKILIEKNELVNQTFQTQVYYLRSILLDVPQSYLQSTPTVALPIYHEHVLRDRPNCKWTSTSSMGNSLFKELTRIYTNEYKKPKSYRRTHHKLHNKK